MIDLELTGGSVVLSVHLGALDEADLEELEGRVAAVDDASLSQVH